MAKHSKRLGTGKVSKNEVSDPAMKPHSGTNKPIGRALTATGRTRETTRVREAPVLRGEATRRRQAVPDASAFRALRDDIIKADARGRITVGNEASDKQYRVLVNGEGQILLDPVVVMPAREAWLFNNPHAAMSILRGIEQSKAGQSVDLGSFAGFANAGEGDE